MKLSTFFISALIVFFTSVTFSQIPFENCIDFDGDGDYANTFNDPYFPTRNGTLEAWVKVRSIIGPIGNPFIEKNEEQWNLGDFYMYFETASGKIKARIQSLPSKPPIETDIASNGSFWGFLDEWIHVAFSWGSDGMKMYINGVLQNNYNSVTHPALNNTYNLYVGADGYMLHSGYYVVSNFFDGQMDELRIWNRQRTSEQIFALWETALEPSYFTTIDSGLVGYWRFDELEDLGVNNDGADDVRDLSVMQNHLDLAGDAHLVISGVIPVELISFNAEQYEGGVKLSWITATELNNQGFDIERKTGNVWEKVGFVEGNGTTTEAHYYTFTDNTNSFIGINKVYYRLKQMDFDGSFEFSDIVEVTINLPNIYNLSQNYPNPFNPVTNIEVSIPESGFINLGIFDILGNKVATVVNKELTVGSYNFKFDGAELSSGIYYYKLTTKNYTAIKKMILLK